MKKVLFKIENNENKISVWRRFSDFQFLATKLVESGLKVPILKGDWVRRFDEAYVKQRREQLDEYLDDLLTMNPEIKNHFDMQAFLYHD